jgi:predicted HD phosphohydrolase
MDGSRPAPSRSPLAEPGFRHLEHVALETMRASDWALLEPQRERFMAGRQARLALDLLATFEHEPSFGYPVNNFRHGLQSATLAQRDGRDEEFVVVCLLHDIGFTLAMPSHGEFAAALLRPFVSDRHHWMLAHHQHFQSFHCHEHPVADRHARERFRGHPDFDYTADFIARFDQNAIDPAVETPPLDHFRPLVERVFARPPRPLP